MKLIPVLVGLWAATAPVCAEVTYSVPPREVRRLSIAVALVDYPVTQTQFRAIVGITEKFGDLPGGYTPYDAEEHVHTLRWELARDSDGGVTFLRISLGPFDKKDAEGYLTVANAVVCYSHPDLGLVVPDPGSFPGCAIDHLKSMRRESGLSIAEFTSLSNLPQYLDRARILMHGEDRERLLRNRPNLK